MLVIEGTDMVGKTTLAKELVRRLNEMGLCYVYQHFTKLPKQWNYYKDYLPFMRPQVVQDRFFMSELVYGVVTRGHTKISREMLRLLEAQMALVGGFTVVITADWKVLDMIWERRSAEEMFDIERIKTVNKGFEQIVEKRWPMPAHYDMHHHISWVDAQNGVVMPTQDTGFIDRLLSAYIARINEVRACYRSATTSSW